MLLYNLYVCAKIGMMCHVWWMHSVPGWSAFWSFGHYQWYIRQEHVKFGAY